MFLKNVKRLQKTAVFIALPIALAVPQATMASSFCGTSVDRVLLRDAFATAELTAEAVQQFCARGADEEAASTVAGEYTRLFNRQIRKTNRRYDNAGGSAGCDPDVASDLDERFPMRELSRAEVRRTIIEVAEGCDGILSDAP